MSFALTLEIEEGCEAASLDIALKLAGACRALESEPVTWRFIDSGLDVLVRSPEKRYRKQADGFDHLDKWFVGWSLILKFRLDRLAEGNADVIRLLEFLSTQTPHKFLLTFQNETVYAVRDEGGVRLFEPLLCNGSGANS